MDGGISTFCRGDKGEFLGRPVRPREAGLESIFGGAIAAGAGPVCRGSGLPAGGGEAARVSQWVLCSRFCDAARHVAPAAGAGPHKGGFEGNPARVSRPGRRRRAQTRSDSAGRRDARPELRAEYFARQVPGDLASGRNRPGPGRRNAALPGSAVWRRSGRHRFHAGFPAAGFQQQEI